IGAIVRHTAGAITAVIGLVLVIGPLAMLLPGKIGDYVYGYMPAEAGYLITKAQQGENDLLSPWEGYGGFAVWTVALLAVAAYLLPGRPPCGPRPAAPAPPPRRPRGRPLFTDRSRGVRGRVGIPVRYR